MAEILQGGTRDLSPQDTSFTVTNHTDDYAFDENTATLGDTSDVLGTVIKVLIKKGILNGTIA